MELKPNYISADQLIETNKHRQIVNCTLSLDCALGGGQTPGTFLLGGKPKIGKSTLALQLAANAQNLYKTKIFYFNIEGRLTKRLLDQIQGIKTDIDNFVICTPPVETDKRGNFVRKHKWYAEQWWELIGQTIMENPNSFIIVDSLGNMSSEKEVSEDMGYQDRGLKNKLEAQFCRKFGDCVISNGIFLVLMVQIMSDTGGGMGPSTIMKVGNAIKHQADIIINCKWAEKFKETNGKILGHYIHANIETSTLGVPNLDVKIPLRYGLGIDKTKDVLDYAIEWGLVDKTSAWYTIPFHKDNNEYQDEINKDICMRFQGEEKVYNWLLVNPKQCSLLEQKIKEKLLLL